MSERGTPTVYEVAFITPSSMLDLMSGGPSPEADEALCLIADVMRRIIGGRAFDVVSDLRARVHRRLAARHRGRKTVRRRCGWHRDRLAGLLGVCSEKARRLSFAGAIERFRADGMGDCREIMVGTA